MKYLGKRINTHFTTYKFDFGPNRKIVLKISDVDRCLVLNPDNRGRGKVIPFENLSLPEWNFMYDKVQSS